MALTTTNFQMVRGDSASFTLAVAFPLGAVSNDLTQHKIWMTAKKTYADIDGSAVFQLSKTAGDIQVDGTNHTVCYIALDPSKTASVECRPPLNRAVLLYDVQLEDPVGNVYTVAIGTLTVQADVTRAV